MKIFTVKKFVPCAFISRPKIYTCIGIISIPIRDTRIIPVALKMQFSHYYTMVIELIAQTHWTPTGQQ
jgi:hypothetical protein